jgi:hypothetical protein
MPSIGRGIIGLTKTVNPLNLALLKAIFGQKNLCIIGCFGGAA